MALPEWKELGRLDISTPGLGTGTAAGIAVAAGPAKRPSAGG